jgi:hypothetical protein
MVTTTGIGIGGTPGQDFPVLLGPVGSAQANLVHLLGTSVAKPTTLTFTPSIYIQGSNTNPTVAPDGAAGCHVEGVTLDTLDHFFLDGTEIPSYTAQGTSAANVSLSSGTYAIGQGSAGAGIRGVVPYAIFYPTPRTAAEVQSISAYVQAQLNRRASFPHYPYFTNSRTAQAPHIGDSLTASYLGSSVWTSAVSYNKTYAVTNYGIGGMTAYDVCKMDAQRWAQSIVPGQTTIHLWAGTNDISQFGRSAQDVWTSITSCVAKVHAYGARIIVATMIDRTGNDANKNAVNALIRSGCPQIGCDYVDDFAEVAAIGADGASATTACFQDGVHLTGPGTGTCATISGTALSGYGIIAALDSNAYNTLDGSSQAAPDISSSNAFVETYANNYVIQTPTAVATHKLVDLAGQTSPRVVVNGSSSFSITVNTTGSQTIAGGAVIPPGTTGIFTPTLSGATTGGGYWTSTMTPSSGSGGSTFQQNGTGLTSSTTVNFKNGTGNGGVAITNPGGAGEVDFNLSLPIAGAGSGFTTGPTSVTSNDMACFTGTTGAIADCFFAKANVVQKNITQTFSATQTFAGIVGGGTTFTVTSGCGTTTSLTGGTMAGSFAAGQTSCAAVITPSITAPHGFACWSNDLTTSADTIHQTATTTTTFTLTGTVATNDVINFGCLAY